MNLHVMYNIFLAKESRAGEQRTALTPSDVADLIAAGHTVSVESQAGLAAGYKDTDYQAVNATISQLDENSLISYTAAFKNIDFIVRVKRPNREREKLEAKALRPGMIMIGALDPFESESDHVNEYHAAGILAYSIDQIVAPSDDPINILAAMSRLAGKLALKDAILKCKNSINKIVIIGLGEAGKSALAEAIRKKFHTVVIVGSEESEKAATAFGADTFFVDRSLSISEQQQKILQIVADADIVITSARKPAQKAPLLIPKTTLDVMKSGSVIVDLAISEGGNVQGSKHDETIITDAGVVITNVSGYPKALPKEASLLWSKASLNFILELANDPDSIGLNPL